MYKFAIFGLFVAVAMALPAQKEISTNELDCLEDDSMFSCLMVKASTALNRAARSSNVEIIDGITFVRDTPFERSAKALTTQSEIEVMNELPRDASDRTLKLVTMLYESAVAFLKSHSLKVNVPEETLSRAFGEGRAKIKKVLLPLIAAAGVKIFALVPIMLGGLGLLVLKAIFVSKIALLLAGILTFQKLFGASSTGSSGTWFNKIPQTGSSWADGTGAQSWNSGVAAQPTQQGYYKRSFDEIKNDAQNLAYSSHAPNSN